MSLEVHDDKLREYGAVTLLQRVLEKYSVAKGITFEEALRVFVDSPIYEVLFDYDLGLWKEGADYIIYLQEEIEQKKS